MDRRLIGPGSALAGAQHRLAEEILADDVAFHGGLADEAVPGQAGRIETDAPAGGHAIDCEDLLGANVGRQVAGRRPWCRGR